MQFTTFECVWGNKFRSRHLGARPCLAQRRQWLFAINIIVPKMVLFPHGWLHSSGDQALHSSTVTGSSGEMPRWHSLPAVKPALFHFIHHSIGSVNICGVSRPVIIMFSPNYNSVFISSDKRLC